MIKKLGLARPFKAIGAKSKKGREFLVLDLASESLQIGPILNSTI